MTELKPTTTEERAELKHLANSEMLLPAPVYWQAICRLIADVERLEAQSKEQRRVEAKGLLEGVSYRT